MITVTHLDQAVTFRGKVKFQLSRIEATVCGRKVGAIVQRALAEDEPAARALLERLGRGARHLPRR